MVASLLVGLLGGTTAEAGRPLPYRPRLQVGQPATPTQPYGYYPTRWARWPWEPEAPSPRRARTEEPTPAEESPAELPELELPSQPDELPAPPGGDELPPLELPGNSDGALPSETPPAEPSEQPPAPLDAPPAPPELPPDLLPPADQTRRQRPSGPALGHPLRQQAESNRELTEIRPSTSGEAGHVGSPYITENASTSGGSSRGRRSRVPNRPLLRAAHESGTIELTSRTARTPRMSEQRETETPSTPSAARPHHGPSPTMNRWNRGASETAEPAGDEGFHTARGTHHAERTPLGNPLRQTAAAPISPAARPALRQPPASAEPPRPTTAPPTPTPTRHNPLR